MLDEREAVRIELHGHGVVVREGLEPLAQDRLAGHLLCEAEALGEVLILTLLRHAEEFDVLVVAAPLHQQTELADEDVRVAEAVPAPGGISSERAAQAAELFDKRADEMKSALGVDAVVCQCEGSHVATCWVGFVTAPFTSHEAGCHTLIAFSSRIQVKVILSDVPDTGL